MDRWREMEAFVAAVCHQSFSAAAREIGVSPSAVSKQISRLENRLGVRLLNRTTRQINLTEPGRHFFESCSEVLQELEAIEEGVTEYGVEVKGKLKVNSSQGFAKYVLLPVLQEFQRGYPQLEIELQLTGQAVDLVEDGVDVAIRLGALPDTSLVGRKLASYRRIICASPDYIERYGEPDTPTDLSAHNCLRLTTSEAFNHWRLTDSEESVELAVSGDFVTDNVEILHDYCLQGMGIARLSSFMVEQDIRAGRLKPLLTHYRTDEQQIHALYPHRKFLPAKVRLFLDFLYKKLS